MSNNVNSTPRNSNRNPSLSTDVTPVGRSAVGRQGGERKNGANLRSGSKKKKK